VPGNYRFTVHISLPPPPRLFGKVFRFFLLLRSWKVPPDSGRRFFVSPDAYSAIVSFMQLEGAQRFGEDLLPFFLCFVYTPFPVDKSVSDCVPPPRRFRRFALDL